MEPVRITAPDLSTAHSPAKPQRTLSFWNALGLVIGLQIGSGIFAAPVYVYTAAGSQALALLAWLLAGILVWHGALILAEFASAIPTNAGIAAYLDYCYGKFWSYLFSVIWIIQDKPCANALISLILADHFSQAMWPGHASKATNIVVAMIALNGVTVFNARGVNLGARAAVWFLFIKITIAASIVILGSAFIISPWSTKAGTGSEPSLRELDMSIAQDSGLIDNITRVVTAMFGAVFAFGGWENLGFIAADIQKPGVNLPKVVHTSVATVLIAFMAINGVVYAILSPSQMAQVDAVAVAFGQTLFGFPGGVVFGLMVVISCVGALNANIFAAARLTQESHAAGFLPPPLGMIPGYILSFLDSILQRGRSQNRNRTRILSRSSSPSSSEMSLTGAMCLNAFLANLYVLVGSFRKLIILKGMFQYIFYCITMTGIYVLRSERRQKTNILLSARQDEQEQEQVQQRDQLQQSHDPDHNQLHRYRGSFISPVIFCPGSAFLVIWMAWHATWSLVVIPLVFTLASAIYFWLLRGGKYPSDGFEPIAHTTEDSP